jgi:NAD(P)H dehydrogenase (quinone)
MNVLTIFAHPGVRSFCHAVLERFDAGLRDAGHTNEIVDLYAIGFDPILRPRDTPSWLTESIPDDMLERMRLRETLLEEAGGPLKRLALKRLIGDRDARGVIRLLRERFQAKDVLVQQQRVAQAEALAFVAPVHFLSFPAILKGWLDRVWTPGFAYDLTADAWRGDINGRRPKLTHQKALIMQTTIFDERAYDAGLREAMRMVIDEFTLTYPESSASSMSTSMPCTARATRRGRAIWKGPIPWGGSSKCCALSSMVRHPLPSRNAMAAPESGVISMSR